MYVLQQCYPKLSMYSQWKTRAPASAPPGLDASSPVQTMLLYDSRQRAASITTAHSAESSRMILTHSSYWTNRDRPTSTHFKLEEIPQSRAASQTSKDNSDSNPAIGNSVLSLNSQSECEAVDSNNPSTSSSQHPPSSTTQVQPKRVRIFAGGFKSTEEYTYVRGRGRGRYVCEECGIRCKKPSMLKKHIRTHTDLRPYTCRQCSFSFKTKGNLTKHMKSKAHHKKCTELGIVPVPTTVDEANIDEDSLARQEKLKKMNLGSGCEIGSGSGNDSDLDDDMDEDGTDSEDEDEEPEGEEEEEDEELNLSVSALAPAPPAVEMPSVSAQSTSEQFEDASEERLVIRGEREEEVARSLLDLGVMAPAGSKPTTYPYASHLNSQEPTKDDNVGANFTVRFTFYKFLCAFKTKFIDFFFTFNFQIPALKSDSIVSPRPNLSVVETLTELKEEKQDSSCIKAIAPPSSTSMSVSSIQFTSNERKQPSLQQQTNLSILHSSPVTTQHFSSSIYSHNVLDETPITSAAARPSLSPSKEVAGVSIQPTTSGMLQAYLTEKALKEGLMKRHQVRLITPCSRGESKNSVIFLSNSSHLIREIQPPNSRALLPPNSTDSVPTLRQELMMPGSHLSISAMPASSASSSAPYKMTDDGKTACSICNKVFTKPSQLRLHINIHYFERPFRCDACAVSFRTKGHLQKHKRSVTHFNKVNMNLTFGTPSTENPRPFKCSDCMIAFRIHGHLAKHLRSKMHIMKLECLGKLPFGTYAEMERSGINLNEIDTTDCHNSLESLQLLAHRLYKQDPSKIQQWQQEVNPFIFVFSYVEMQTLVFFLLIF